MVELIRMLASKRDTTLKAVERELGLGNGTIARWDNNSPSVDKLEKLADYFGISVDYLLGRTDKPEVNK